MRFFLRYGAFNMTFFYLNKSSDQLYAYSMLNKYIKNTDLDKI